jgi:transcriptional regulator GlxA family with amidase domain
MQIAIALYPELTALDFVGPYQVFTNLLGSEIVLCAESRGRLKDDAVLNLEIEHTFDDVPHPDVLLVPGGFITRKIARDGGAIVDWVKQAHETTQWTTSVCTGSLILGAAGILEGKTATTHWGSYDHLAAYGATPTEQRVVQDGKVVTAAGVSSGIDLALWLVGQWEGDAMAQAIQLGIEYDPQPPYDAGAPSKAPKEVLDLVRSLVVAKEEEILSS